MKHHSRKFGFTMIELLVTIGIFTLLMGVVLAKYNTFTSHAVFSNSIENLVLTLRQAQVYGAGTKKGATASGAVVSCIDQATGLSSPFNCQYGVHIPAQDPQYAYKIFVDVNGNHRYDANAGEDVETITWDNTVYIKTLSCGVELVTTSTSPGSCASNFIDIIFARPKPDAYITDSLRDPYTVGSILINSNTTSDIAAVTVSSTGQIYMKQF